MITDDALLNLAWDVLPFCLLSPEQQIKFKNQAQTRRYILGEIIWAKDLLLETLSDNGSANFRSQSLIIAGSVRLVSEQGESVILNKGDWLGDLLELEGAWKARAKSKDVVVLHWDCEQWQTIASPDLNQFWATQRSRYESPADSAPQPVSGYPFVSGFNTAACCLTMVAQHLQNPAQLEWVQRCLRSTSPKNVVEAAEKLGLQLRRLQTNWSDLRQLSFPALLHWQQESWVVVYGFRGDRLIIANPLNPSKTCESLPKETVTNAWNGQLWQVELIQKHDKFNISWFLPAVWRYRWLLGEYRLNKLG